MAEIVDIKVEFISRRTFIENLMRTAKVGLLSGAGLYLLSRCSGSIPVATQLDPPFICVPGAGCSPASVNTAPTISLVFSAYNPESGFTGYNVWYGPAATIQSNWSVKNHSLVLNSTPSTTLSVASIGGTTLPSYLTSSTVNATVQITLTIAGTVGGSVNSIFVTAYNLTDNLDSALSNQLVIL